MRTAAAMVDNPYQSPQADNSERSIEFARRATRAYRSVRNLGRYCIAMTIVGMLISAVKIVVWVAERGSIVNAMPGKRDFREGVGQIMPLISKFELLEAATEIFVLIAFLSWFYLAYANLLSLGYRRLGYHRAWAIAGWFIPVVWWILPYRILREIWSRSDPRNLGRETWEEPGHGAIQLWWALSILIQILVVSSNFILSGLGEVRGLVAAMDARMLVEAIGIVSSRVFIHLILTIRRRQDERHARLQELAGEIIECPSSDRNLREVLQGEENLPVPPTPAPLVYRSVSKVGRYCALMILIGIPLRMVVIANWVAARPAMAGANPNLGAVRTAANRLQVEMLTAGLLSLVLALCLLPTFFFWFHRAYTNLLSLGWRRLHYERYWTIAGWFVPVMWWFRPYEIVREIWRRSYPPGKGEAFDEEPSRVEIRIWWILVLTIHAILGIAIVIDLFAASLRSQIWEFDLRMVVEGLGIPVAAILVHMILTIGKWQDQRHQQLHKLARVRER